jgi:ABC-type sugar transport system ATPase subunit
VDVGARAEIYGVLRDVTARGTAVLAITSDLEEALAIADRVLIMRQGRLIAALARPLTAAQIAGLMVPA